MSRMYRSLFTLLIIVTFLFQSSGPQMFTAGTHTKSDTLRAMSLARRAPVKASSSGLESELSPVRTIDELRGHDRILFATDWNVSVKDGEVSDPSRLAISVPSIERLLENPEVREIFVMTHRGRPAGDGYEDEFSLKPVVDLVRDMLARDGVDAEVVLLPYTLAGALETIELTRRTYLDKKVVFVFENIRFYAEERSDEPKERAGFAAALKNLTEATAYVNEAFDKCHRPKETSMEMVGLFDPANRAAGLNLTKQVNAFIRFEGNTQRPWVLIFGGAKFDKFKTMAKIAEQILRKGDTIVIVGALANAWLAAEHKNVGHSLLPKKEADAKLVQDSVRKIKTAAQNNGFNIIVPSDYVLEDSPGLSSTEIGNGRALDIGKDTQADIVREIGVVATNGQGSVILNGGTGMFEDKLFRSGTMAVIKAASLAAARRGITVLAIGGDMNNAIKIAREEEGIDVSDKIEQVTGGGVMLEVLLKGVEGLATIKAVLKEGSKTSSAGQEAEGDGASYLDKIARIQQALRARDPLSALEAEDIRPIAEELGIDTTNLNTVFMLTGGGDCAGINNMLAHSIRLFDDAGIKVVGIRQAFKGAEAVNFDDFTLATNRETADKLMGAGSTFFESAREDPFKKGNEAKADQLIKNLAGALITDEGQEVTIEDILNGQLIAASGNVYSMRYLLQQSKDDLRMRLLKDINGKIQDVADTMDARIVTEKGAIVLMKKPFRGLIATGGDDHLTVTWKLHLIGIRPTIAVPKSMDNDFWTQMLGFHTAWTKARETVWAIANSAVTHQKSQVIEVFGRATGHVAFKAAMKYPEDREALEKGTDTSSRGLLMQLDRCYPAMMILLPDTPTSLASVLNRALDIALSQTADISGRMSDLGCVVVTVAEGFTIPETDPVLWKILELDSELRERFFKVKSLDAHGNPKLAGVGGYIQALLDNALTIAEFIGDTELIRKARYAKENGYLKGPGENVVRYMLRGLTPDEYDARLAEGFAQLAYSLIAGRRSGLAATLDEQLPPEPGNFMPQPAASVIAMEMVNDVYSLPYMKHQGVFWQDPADNEAGERTAQLQALLAQETLDARIRAKAEAAQTKLQAPKSSSAGSTSDDLEPSSPEALLNNTLIQLDAMLTDPSSVEDEDVDKEIEYTRHALSVAIHGSQEVGVKGLIEMSEGDSAQARESAQQLVIAQQTDRNIESIRFVDSRLTEDKQPRVVLLPATSDILQQLLWAKDELDSIKNSLGIEFRATDSYGVAIAELVREGRATDEIIAFVPAGETQAIGQVETILGKSRIFAMAAMQGGQYVPFSQLAILAKAKFMLDKTDDIAAQGKYKSVLMTIWKNLTGTQLTSIEEFIENPAMFIITLLGAPMPADKITYLHAQAALIWA